MWQLSVIMKELVESGLIWVVYQNGKEMQSDLFIKNLPKCDFDHLASYYVGSPDKKEDRKG